MPLTKLHVPSPRSHWVRRDGLRPAFGDRILQKLQQGQASRLILVSAAARFGKTSALSDWVQQAQHPVGWLSLDERDNDPIRFWTYLVTALQQADGMVGEQYTGVLNWLQSHQTTPYLLMKRR